jgi:hypothetical protein
MNPFAQLVRVDAPLPPPKAPSDDATDTATLRRLLHGRGPLTTAALADATGLALYRVRNLLGRGKASGRVFWDGRHWSINHQYLGVDVLRAAALLRAQGWRVSAPSALDMAQPDIGSGAKCAPAESNPWGLSAGQIRVMNAVLAQGLNKNAARAAVPRPLKQLSVSPRCAWVAPTAWPKWCCGTGGCARQTRTMGIFNDLR